MNTNRLFGGQSAQLRCCCCSLFEFKLGSSLGPGCRLEEIGWEYKPHGSECVLQLLLCPGRFGFDRWLLSVQSRKCARTIVPSSTDDGQSSVSSAPRCQMIRTQYYK